MTRRDRRNPRTQRWCWPACQGLDQAFQRQGATEPQGVPMSPSVNWPRHPNVSWVLSFLKALSNDASNPPSSRLTSFWLSASWSSMSLSSWFSFFVLLSLKICGIPGAEVGSQGSGFSLLALFFSALAPPALCPHFLKKFTESARDPPPSTWTHLLLSQARPIAGAQVWPLRPGEPQWIYSLRRISAILLCF